MGYLFDPKDQREVIFAGNFMTDDAPLRDIVSALDEHIKVLRSFGFDDTAKIFAIAKLDLMTRLHGISDEELEAFCAAQGSGPKAATDDAHTDVVVDLAARKRGKN
jgi:hypothetical protein